MTASIEAFPAAAAPAAPLARTRPFYWSVRREIWENRAIYLAPLVAAGVVLFGIVLGHLHLLHVAGSQTEVGPGHFGPPTHRPLPFLHTVPYLIAAAAIMFTSCVVGIFYCLAALNGERRDRSVLFWKSLPVSDVTTVLSKAAVPAVILPLVTFVVIFVTHLVMLALDLGSAAAASVPIGQIWLDLGWAFLMLAFWWAPVWGWLLLVSAWSKRMTFLWGVGPPLALCVIERLALGTDYAFKLLGDRLTKGIGVGFTTPRPNTAELPWPDPGPFLVSPGLWIGLVVGAAFLAGAVWLRRRREPI